jgi:ankyrin repeat protein
MEGCIAKRDLASLNRLIEAKADVNAYTGDKRFFSHLVAALIDCWWDGAEALVAAKANVNGCSVDGWSVLQEAAWTNNVRAVKFLMQHGVNVDAHTAYDNTTALYVASKDRSWHSLRELCRATKAVDALCGWCNQTALSYSIRTNNPTAASLLLDAGAQTSAINEHTVWPPWFAELVQQRRNIKRTLIAFFACARPLVGKDVTKLVLTMVWETRDFPSE